MNKFQSKTSYVIITFFLGAIIVSFALTGFEGFNSTQGTVGSVDGEPIQFSEYQNMYNQELNRFQQMFGGNSLTPQQIRQFRIKEGVVNRLVQQKLILNLAKDMNLEAGTEEIKAEIKKSPFFLTDKKFDVRKYRALLAQNRYTPAKYEELVGNDIASRKIFNLISNMTSSQAYTRDILRFKKNIISARAAVVEKESLTEYINIPKDELKAFMADSKNDKILEGVFNSMKSEFNKPATVKARHILLKTEGKKEADVLKKAKALRKRLTAKNFAKIAGKETEDASGKGTKGGDLGEFTKGRMVPAFEKAAFSMKPGQISDPVKTSFGYHIIYVEKSKQAVTKTLKDVKSKVATRHLQKSNRKALNELVTKIKEDIIKGFDSNNYDAVRALAKKYKIKFYPKADFNQFDLRINGVNHSADKLRNLFDEKNTVSKDDTPIRFTIVKVNTRTAPAALKTTVDKELSAETKKESQAFVNLLQQEITKYLQDNAKVVTYTNIL